MLNLEAKFLNSYSLVSNKVSFVLIFYSTLAIYLFYSYTVTSDSLSSFFKSVTYKFKYFFPSFNSVISYSKVLIYFFYNSPYYLNSFAITNCNLSSSSYLIAFSYMAFFSLVYIICSLNDILNFSSNYLT